MDNPRMTGSLALLFVLFFGSTLGNVYLAFDPPYQQQTSILLDSRAAQFGPPLNEFVGLVQFIQPPNEYACLPFPALVRPTSNMSTIAVIKRGQSDDTLPDCTFLVKVKTAQDAGFDAVIIYDDVDEDPFVMGGGDDSVLIPSVLVTQNSGVVLSNVPNYTLATLTGDPILKWPSFLLTFVIVVSCVIFLFTVFMLYRRRLQRLRAEPKVERLTKTEALNLPSRLFIQADDGVDSCCVCLEEYKANDVLVLLPCKHKFHKECVEPWLTCRRRVCPMCKRDPIVNGVPMTENSPLLA